MTLQELINNVEIRLDYLKSIRLSKIQLNDQEIVNQLDVEILETEQTLQTLKNS